MSIKKISIIFLVVLSQYLVVSPEAAAIDLKASEKSVFSQNGEDGVIEKIFEIIEPTNRWAVEFGAGDGDQFSNTRNLIVNHDWNVFMMEGDAALAAQAASRYGDNPKVKAIQAWVFPGNIEILLEENGVPKDLDLISIDIDSNDYYVWNVLHEYRPKVVLIEFNASYAPPQNFVVDFHPMLYWDGSDYYGASIQSMYELGKKKGYELIYCDLNGVNLFFVDSRYFPLFEIEDNSPEALYNPPQFGVKDGGRAPNGRGWHPHDSKNQNRSHRDQNRWGVRAKRWDGDVVWDEVRIEKRPVLTR
jgi:hypothetical protein